MHKNHMSNPNERYLWHGTIDEIVPQINTNGFNRSYAGSSGMAFITLMYRVSLQQL